MEVPLLPPLALPALHPTFTHSDISLSLQLAVTPSQDLSLHSLTTRIPCTMSLQRLETSTPRGGPAELDLQMRLAVRCVGQVACPCDDS
ncbi:hypothetical protein M430DRAFT_33907 [Amorphotheca resinae ATCC 22711]|jgi:hypothetical protein|uniref:Uncharacterized protein n=1 Tax=Amorphotheca resinae ATCC 22711 TaxID=857342 RepID=A0A2T3B9A6_AMORE|nr:hypothetical protein M430DRAFT_33907 [Amorphotheca resinae ATCC 22711]PSS23456.1 hypothetical protein M430DRAFT_33907 [Amorphotheca resinae ATCC 22711]